MSTERRLQARKVPKDFTYIRVEEDSGGRVLNVSEEGLCFEALSPIRYTESFHFWLSFNLIDRIDGAGQVVWMDTGKRTAGIRFMELSEFAREQIRAWVNETAVEEAATNGNGFEVVEMPLTSADLVESAAEPSVADVAAEVPEELAASVGSATREEAVDSNPEMMSLPAEAASESRLLRELIPLKRHLSAARMQFIRGIGVGVVICTVIALPILKYMSSRPGKSTSIEVPGAPATVNAGSLTESQVPSSGSDAAKRLFLAPVGSKPLQLKGSSRSAGDPVERTAARQNLAGTQAFAADSESAASKSREQPSGSPVGNDASKSVPVAGGAGDAGTGAGSPPSAERSGTTAAGDGRLTTSAANRGTDAQRTSEPGSAVVASTAAPGTNASSEAPAVRGANPVSPTPIGGDVRPPRLLKSTAPIYPSLARTQRVAGDVQLDALVDASGNVGVIKVLSGPLLLQRAAADAVRHWKYTPGVLDGKPTPMHINVVLKFRIP